MTRLGQEGFGLLPLLKPGHSSSGTSQTASALYTGNKLVNISGNGGFYRFPLIGYTGGSFLFVRYSKVTPVNNLGNVNYVTLLGDGGAQSHLTIGANATGFPTLSRTGGGIIATGTFPINTDVRVHYELMVSISDAGGRFVLKVNGVTCIDFTGDTKSGGTNSYIDSIQFNSIGGAAATQIGDVVWQDSNGAAPYNDFMGDQLIITSDENNNGASSQFLGSDGNSVDNYLLGDETPLNTTDYVSDNVVGHRDLYEVTDLPVAGTVHSVQSHIYAMKTDAGARSIKFIERSATGPTIGSLNTAPLNTVFSVHSSDLMTLDADGTAWTKTKYDAAQFGIELV